MIGTDLPVISAHHGEQVYAFWANGRCSHCTSITPEAFAQQIAEGQVQAGWEWCGDVPLYTETGAGRFYFEHLVDTGEGWLMWWQADIALATGVVFYWEREILRFRTFVDRDCRRYGEALDPDVVDQIMAFLSRLDQRLVEIG